MLLVQLVFAPFMAMGASSALIPSSNSNAVDVAKRNLFKPLYPLPSNTTTSASRSCTSPPTHSQPPPPPTNASCDSPCHCATGDKPVPMDGRYLCGWCAAVSTEPGHLLNVTDVVLCKDGGCCNYGVLDGRCEKALEENPPDFETWCPWPVQELDPPKSTTTGWPMPTTPPSTPIVTMPISTSTCAPGNLSCGSPCPTDEPGCDVTISSIGLQILALWIIPSSTSSKRAIPIIQSESLR